jgi:hypothetical protein
MNDNIKYLGKATILENAPVGQDFGYIQWRDSSVIFDVYDFDKDRVECKTHGYGQIGSREGYGSGALYVNKKYLCWIEKEQKPVRLKNIGWYKRGAL